MSTLETPSEPNIDLRVVRRCIIEPFPLFVSVFSEPKPLPAEDLRALKTVEQEQPRLQAIIRHLLPYLGGDRLDELMGYNRVSRSGDDVFPH